MQGLSILLLLLLCSLLSVAAQLSSPSLNSTVAANGTEVVLAGTSSQPLQSVKEPLSPKSVVHEPPQAMAPQPHVEEPPQPMAPQPLLQDPLPPQPLVQESSNGFSAADLKLAALKAGYHIPDMTPDLAASSSSAELTEELLPEPEALVHRQRPDLRDRMIGMTFLGQPIPLERRPRRPSAPESRSSESRRRSGGPKRRQPAKFPRRRNDITSSASRAHVIFPSAPGRPGGPASLPMKGLGAVSLPRSRPQGVQPSRSQPQGFIPKVSDSRPTVGRPVQGSNSRTTARTSGHQPGSRQPINVFDLREEPAQHSQLWEKPIQHGQLRKNPVQHDHLPVGRPLQEYRALNDQFDNNVGPDFGPVIYEFDHNINENMPNSFINFDSPKIVAKAPAASFPTRFSHGSPSSELPTLAPPPKPFHPSKPFSTSFSNLGGSVATFQDKAFSSQDEFLDKKSDCTQYTETICLDADNYPHAEILASLEGDKRRTSGLIAEVRNQSADNLVDGLTARQEEKYDLAHYFGNRRQDTNDHRDFADEGGYLCPSEVKYARPKRARNSKAQWKFVVNMDKYTQTIRMEKCIQPGGACSYVSHHYQATCNQVHNYQRLLAWEKKRGLHMDIFKVPSCCTCHIQGYSFVFPPLGEKEQPRQRPPHQSRAGSRIVERRVPGADPGEMTPNSGPFSPPDHGNPVKQAPRSDQPPPGRHPPSYSRTRGQIRRVDVPVAGGEEARAGQQPRAGGSRRRAEQGAAEGHGSINYDYHPILQFFDGYQ